MIIAAYCFLFLAVVLSIAGIGGGVLLCVAWWHDRRAARGWRKAADLQKHSRPITARDNSSITKTTTTGEETESSAASTATRAGV